MFRKSALIIAYRGDPRHRGVLVGPVDHDDDGVVYDGDFVGWDAKPDGWDDGFAVAYVVCPAVPGAGDGVVDQDSCGEGAAFVATGIAKGVDCTIDVGDCDGESVDVDVVQMTGWQRSER